MQDVEIIAEKTGLTVPQVKNPKNHKEGINKGNRIVGIVSLIIGVVIITADCIKFLL